MAGVLLQLTLQGMDEARAALARLSALDLENTAFAIGQLLENSTRMRIAEQKRAPNGSAWAPWSEAHAETRQPRHSLLVEDNNLVESVQNYTTGTEVRVGSPLVYAAIHQLGGQAGRGLRATIPARPYLGLSDEDGAAIRLLVLDDVERALQ